VVIDKSMPTMSIVVPVYKVESYLKECIESVLDQSFRDFELILVDDGSPDNCPAICDEYAARDSRIRVIHKENGGLSDARNAGLDVATGKYIYFLDGDDYVHPDLLERINSSMEPDTDLFVFNYWEQTEDGKINPYIYAENGCFSLQNQEERYSFFLNTLLCFNIGWAAWNRVFVRENIEKYNLRFVDNRRIFAEDLCFSLCYCAHVTKIKMIDDYLHYYRIRGGSLTAEQRKKLNINQYNELGKAVWKFYTGFEDCDYLVNNYYAIHYMIIAEPLAVDYRKMGMAAPEFRKLIYDKIVSWDFFELQMQEQLRNYQKKRTGFGRLEVLEHMSFIKFCLGGSYTVLRVQLKLLGFVRRMLGR